MNQAKQRQHCSCPSCKASVLNFEGDQFCVKCDWSTMFADVQSGRFAERLGLNKPKKPKKESSVIFIDELDAEEGHVIFDDVSA